MTIAIPVESQQQGQAFINAITQNLMADEEKCSIHNGGSGGHVVNVTSNFEEVIQEYVDEVGINTISQTPHEFEQELNTIAGSAEEFSEIEPLTMQEIIASGDLNLEGMNNDVQAPSREEVTAVERYTTNRNNNPTNDRSH